MKKSLMFLLMLVLLTTMSFGDGFSGETRADAVVDNTTGVIVGAVDAGFVYGAGAFTFAADAYFDSNLDLDVGIPLSVTFGGLVLKAEPGLDNLLVSGSEIYGIDGDIIYTLGKFKFEAGFGYGTDEVLDISAAITATDLFPGLVLDAKLLDATDIFAGTIGKVEVGATLKY